MNHIQSTDWYDNFASHRCCLTNFASDSEKYIFSKSLICSQKLSAWSIENRIILSSELCLALSLGRTDHQFASSQTGSKFRIKSISLPACLATKEINVIKITWYVWLMITISFVILLPSSSETSFVWSSWDLQSGGSLREFFQIQLSTLRWSVFCTQYWCFSPTSQHSATASCQPRAFSCSTVIRRWRGWRCPSWSWPWAWPPVWVTTPAPTTSSCRSWGTLEWRLTVPTLWWTSWGETTWPDQTSGTNAQQFQGEIHSYSNKNAPSLVRIQISEGMIFLWA